MAKVTLRVLDGADRGRVYEGEAPITIGREEGNLIQLNDERVSRFHVKIQEDHNKLVLTDLESTNGTKVNGEAVQLRILRFGDMISIGRSVLLFGSRKEIAQRLQKLKRDHSKVSSSGEVSDIAEDGPFDEELLGSIDSQEPPELPLNMSPGQSAQLFELITYVSNRIRALVTSIEVDRKENKVNLEFAKWQELLDLQASLAVLLKQIGDPDSPE